MEIEKLRKRVSVSIKAINRYVKSHSVCGSTLPIPDGDPGCNCPTGESIRPWLESRSYINEWNDGSPHDQSVIKRLFINTVLGGVIVWSYNNNAWGFADAYLKPEAPETVFDFCRCYVDNVGNDGVEAWLLEMSELA